MTAALVGSSSAARHTLPTATAARPGASVALVALAAHRHPPPKPAKFDWADAGRNLPICPARPLRRGVDGLSPSGRPQSRSSSADSCPSLAVGGDVKVTALPVPRAYCAQAADKTAASSLLRADPMASVRHHSPRQAARSRARRPIASRLSSAFRIASQHSAGYPWRDVSGKSVTGLYMAASRRAKTTPVGRNHTNLCFGVQI